MVVRSIKIILFLIYCLGSQYVSAQKSAVDSLKNLLSKNIPAKERANILNKISQKENSLAAFKDPPIPGGKPFAMEALEISRKIGYKEGEAESLGNLGDYYGRDSIDYNKLRDYWFSAAEIYLMLKDSLSYVESLIHVAYSYEQQEIYTMAVPLNEKIFKHIPKDKKYAKETAFILGELYDLQALVYFKTGRFDEAVTNFTKAIEIYKQEDKESAYLTTSMLRAYVLLKQGQLTRAEAEAHRVYKEYELSNKKAMWIPPYWYYPILTEICIEKEKYDSALYYLERAKYVTDSLGLIGSSDYKYLLGSIKLGQGLYSEAEKLLHFDTVNVETWYETKAGFKRKLALLYEKKGNLKRAIQLYQESNRIQDSLSKAQIDLHINNVEKLIESDQHEYELRFIQAQLSYELKQKRIIIISVVVVSTLLAFLFYSIVRSRNKIKKKNFLLDEQNREITTQNEEIASQAEQLSLKNKLLEEQNEKLEELNLEKEGLMGIVAHDLRAPLNRILGLAGLLRSRNLEKDDNDVIGKMEQVSNQGLKLIREILEVSSIDFNETHYDTSDITLKALIRDEIISQFLSQANVKGIGLAYIVSEDIVLKCDPFILRRILENLVSNAIKFSQPNTSIIVQASRFERMVEISVQDQGPGISLDDQRKMFRKFQRLSAKPTAGESSTGLGLAIVKGLVEKLNGEILVESNVGIGTEFIVRLQVA